MIYLKKLYGINHNARLNLAVKDATNYMWCVPGLKELTGIRKGKYTMFHINEKDVEYRFGDSGPKYFMRGPRIGMGQARLKVGEDFMNHYHNDMEESFFMLKGKVEFVIDGKSYIGEKGDLYSVAPKESHYLKNVGDEEAIILFCLAPFEDGDKENVPL